MNVYQLLIEDMTTLGAMGSSPTTISRELYSNLRSAQNVAEDDYREQEENPGAVIEWKKSRTRWSSGDLRYTMYTIREIEVWD